MTKRPVAIGAIAAALAWGPPPGLAAGDDDAVMAVTQAVCDAFRSRDAVTLDALLAPDFTLVGSDGVAQPRAQAFDEVRAGEPRYDVFRNHDMTADVRGDAATVRGVTSLSGTAGGKSFAVDVRFVDTLVRTDGRWRLVESRVTRLPAAASPAASPAPP